MNEKEEMPLRELGRQRDPLDARTAPTVTPDSIECWPLPWRVRERYQACDGNAADGSADCAFAEVAVIAANGALVHYARDDNEMDGEAWDAEVAKARLLAAAPDLVAALRNWQNYEQTLERRQNAASAAIDKAEGRP